MKTLSLSSPSGKLRKIKIATSSLLQEISDAPPPEAEMMRAEASRLNGISFSLTRYLCYDQIEKAYTLICGDPDEDGTSLGLVG